MKRTPRKSPRRRKSSPFSHEDYNSGDGMLTSVWGPVFWFFLHTMSFNYPVKPTEENKKHYRDFILSLKDILPCKYCRDNFKLNMQKLPLTMEKMKNRETFSKYVYELHEVINTMLNKKSHLSYEDVRERFEIFRAKCIEENPKKTPCKKKKHSGCVKPFYGKKSKCILKIVPYDKKVDTVQIHKSCKLRK